MKNPLTLLSGATLGAALMYFYDPANGARRRALIRDQALSGLADTGNAIEPATEDLTNRTTGLLYELRKRLVDEDVSNYVLKERVRAEMGRWTSHPGAIAVSAFDGHVSLHGPILQHEVEDLLGAIGRIPGVNEVDNQLTVHATRGNVPGLQGGDVPAAVRPGPWPPAKRLLAGVFGGTVTGFGIRRGGLLGSLLTALGLASLVRALSGIRSKRLVGLDSGHRAVDIQKTLEVDAPVDEVFRFWDNFENFPRFMSHLAEVEDLGEGRSHWVISGPAGTSVSWDARVTRRRENEELAWASGEGTPVQNAGTVH
ncbi:MAG TPA: SRPBCC family protein, partial [Candidatus Binatia bacterium]|nr:SRPBCC family protein [Candidatus Binatia bacterium]